MQRSFLIHHLTLWQREDNRGVMEVLYRRREQSGGLRDFEIIEQRIYKIPKKHTFLEFIIKALTIHKVN